MSGKSKTGFTLAEVLITLSIIGVVAALTIPSLKKNYEKQQWITGFKTAYSTLSQATMMVAANNGGSLMDAWDMTGGEHSLAMYNAYLPYLKITLTDVENNHIKLNNGQDLWFYSYNPKPQVWSFIIVDSNGISKGPNVYGKDVQRINIDFVKNSISANIYTDWETMTGEYTEEQITSCCPDDLNFDTSKPGTGDTCALRILRGDYGTAY